MSLGLWFAQDTCTIRVGLDLNIKKNIVNFKDNMDQEVENKIYAPMPAAILSATDLCCSGLDSQIVDFSKVNSPPQQCTLAKA